MTAAAAVKFPPKVVSNFAGLPGRSSGKRYKFFLLRLLKKFDQRVHGFFWLLFHNPVTGIW